MRPYLFAFIDGNNSWVSQTVPNKLISIVFWNAAQSTSSTGFPVGPEIPAEFASA